MTIYSHLPVYYVFFICFYVSSSPFVSAWRTSFTISCKAVLVVMNSLSFSLFLYSCRTTLLGKLFLVGIVFSFLSAL